jgi:MYXO-CTERM domain-containing protein
VNRVVLAALAALTLIPSTASAYVREQSNWDPNTLPIHYYVNQSSIPSSLGSAGVGAVDAGFTTWAGPSCTSWRAADSGNTSSHANTGDGVNVIEWVSGSWPAELGDVNTVIGITTPVWTVGGYFNDADIRFNNVGFHWVNGPGSGGSVDAQSIATHEEGHFLGLDHTPINGAVMYASYSGGEVRNLSNDDQSGVCAIYPSGVAPMDAGVMSGTDPCNPLGNTCDACTANNNCGWCPGSSMCMTGTQGGPTMGSCGGGWAWFPQMCSATGTDAGSGGTGRFGDPCMSPNDCGSGGICAGSSATTATCTRACTDDCGCPDGYQCVPTTDPSLKVCAPGTRSCSTPGNDAAVVPGNDAAVVPGNDAGPVVGLDSGTPGIDAGSFDPNADGGAVGTRHTHAGCSCSTTGGHGGLGGAMLFAGIASVLVTRRRRR